MWKAVSLGMAALFVVFALVQLNDPDPAAWVLAYGITALFSAYSAFRPAPWLQIALWALFALFLGLRLLLAWDGTSNPMGSAWQGPLSEEVVREGLGLLLVAVWMAVVAAHDRQVATPEE